MGKLIEVLNFMWKNWEENWNYEKATDLNHIVANMKVGDKRHFVTLGELPFPKELIEATMKEFHITEDFVIGQNLQRLRRIQKGAKISMTVSDEDMKIANRLFPPTNLHGRKKEQKTVARTILEVLEYLKENDTRQDKVDLNTIATSKRTFGGRSYTKINELPFPRELIEDVVKRFNINEDFIIGQNLLGIKSAMNGSKATDKFRQEDIEFAKQVFRSFRK